MKTVVETRTVVLKPDAELLDVCKVPEYHGTKYIDIHDFAGELWLALLKCEARDKERLEWYEKQEERTGQR